MKIDWKIVCQSAGYKSLKAAYQKTLQNLQRYSSDKHTWYVEREKKEAKDKFQWVIARATHYAHYLNTTIDAILDNWEDKRNYNWQNYYQDCRQPKLNKSEHVKPQKPIKYYRNEVKTARNTFNRILARKRVFRTILEEQKKNSKRKDKTARWSKNKKWLRDYHAGKIK